MKLEEGEVVCSKCLGSGKDEDGFTCKKCYGEGKVDWITNAINADFPKSALDRVNVRRMILNVRHSVERAISENMVKGNPMAATEQFLHGYLDNMKQNRLIMDWKVESNYGEISIFLRPSMTIETVRIDFKL